MAKMKEAIDRVKGAVCSKDLVLELTHYYINNGMIQASDGNITAATKFPDDRTYLVPAKEFDTIIHRMPDDPDITLNENDVILKCGRLRGTIPILRVEDYTMLQPEGVKKKVDGVALLNSLKLLRPFVSDNAIHAWSIALILSESGAYATNNAVLVHDKMFPIKEPQVLLPIYAVDFMLGRQGEITHYSLTDNSMSFFWQDGSWMRTQLIGMSYPEQVVTMIEGIPEEIPALGQEWIDTVRGLCDISEDTVRIERDKVTVGRGKAQVVAEIESEHEALFAAKFLNMVLQNADSVDFSTYPKPCPFKGDGFVGLIAGRNR